MNGVKAILLMAGVGTRFNDPLPKQFHLLMGKKLYLWTLEKFSQSSLFEEILLVCPPDKVNEIQNEVASMAKVIPGGQTRQQSSYLGIQACGSKTEIVVIHDAVRPLISEKILKANIEGAREFGAVDTCIPSSDTIVHSREGEKIDTIPKRSEYFRGQTPQSFSYPLILKSHQETKQNNATDDCQLVHQMGKDVHIVDGAEENIKITTAFDLLVAESLLKKSL